MEKEIKITKADFSYSFEGVKSILKKFQKINSLPKKVKKVIVELDFNKSESSHLNLALIWRLLLELRSKDFNVIIKYNDSVEPFLNDRHFFDRLTGKRSFGFNSSVPLHFETFNPVRPSTGNENAGVDQIFSDVTKKFLDPKHPLHTEIKIQMLEVITNAFDHSESTSEAGSVCSLDNKNLLDFCVIDMGQGIKGSFLDNPVLRSDYKELSDQEVISKATEFRISCNPSNARNPKYVYSNGGIGLFFLKEFIKNHKNSHLIIISQKGYYYIDSNGKEAKRTFSGVGWKGTVVNFRVDVNQSKSKAYEKLCENYIENIDSLSINIV